MLSRVWWATVHGVMKSWTRLNDSHFHFHGCIVIFVYGCVPVKMVTYKSDPRNTSSVLYPSLPHVSHGTVGPDLC